MTDITERLRSGFPSILAQRDGADELDRLRARLETDGHAHLDGAHLRGKVDGCLLCEAMTERETLRARVAELEAERADDDALRERMADTLKRTAIALRGPEPPLTAWSWHDLPERAAAAIASIYLFERVARDLSDQRARVAELEDERDAAFKMSRCECDSDEACANLVALHRRVAELEAAKGEPVAFLHQVVCGDGEPDQALSFAPDNFPLAGALGYRSLSYVPLYTAPRVDVDAISDDLIDEATTAFIAFVGDHGGILDTKNYRDDMRAALRAIFNKGE